VSSSNIISRSPEQTAHASQSFQKQDKKGLFYVYPNILKAYNAIYEVFQSDLKNYTRFETLALPAKKFLCPPPSTVPSERVLSEMGMICDPKRGPLTGHHAHQPCFLHYNLKFLNFKY